ncbi:hypothetical protein QQF64_003943 [Cirrhinus molitorella]|uniref:Uncharacterized protein n=1 Tax=Cirrhinus molitorella TaxID=172907 RepID=A0ABR3MMR7_9TELE
MQTGGMWETEKIEREKVRQKERGERKQVRTALTESNEGQVEKLICDSSGFAEKNQKDKVSLKTPERYVITLAEPTEVSPVEIIENGYP